MPLGIHVEIRLEELLVCHEGVTGHSEEAIFIDDLPRLPLTLGAFQLHVLEKKVCYSTFAKGRSI